MPKHSKLQTLPGTQKKRRQYKKIRNYGRNEDNRNRDRHLYGKNLQT